MSWWDDMPWTPDQAGEDPYYYWTEGLSVEDEYFVEPHEEPEEAEYTPALREALEKLTPKQRFVVELKWGLRGDRLHSFREIAELMSVDVRAAYDHYRYGMKKLGKVLNS